MGSFDSIDWKKAGGAFEATHVIQPIEPTAVMLDFLDWWRSFITSPRRMPSRSALRMETCPPRFFPNLGLMRIEPTNDGFRLQVRLAGEHVLERFPNSGPGTWLDAHPRMMNHPLGRTHALETFCGVARIGQPQAFEGHWTFERRVHRYKRLVCPLGEDGEQVDHLLLFFEFGELAAPLPQKAR